MALARWTGIVQDEMGNAVSGALIEVRREGDNALQALFSDRAGTVGLGNPFTADDATFFFHAAGGSYRIKASKDGFEQEWRYISLGTAAELDAEQLQSDIEEGLNTAVRVAEQDLEEDQQEQVRLNIGAASAEALAALAEAVEELKTADAPFTKEYISAQQVITLGGTLTLTHSLGAAPKLMTFEAVCAVAEGGYAVGETMVLTGTLDHVGVAQSFGQIIRRTATNILVRFGSNGFVGMAMNPSTGAIFQPTAANWRFVVRAWA